MLLLRVHAAVQAIEDLRGDTILLLQEMLSLNDVTVYAGGVVLVVGGDQGVHHGIDRGALV